MSEEPVLLSSVGVSGVLNEVGGTPLIPLGPSVADRVPAGVEIWLKAEWFNPGGSVKDRAALSMILEAERTGRLSPGATVLDASSGNTGIALAMAAAARGYRLVLCLPKNANAERKQLLATYGAEVVATSPLEGSDGAIRRARELAAEHPEWVYLDQYSNDANWRAHYRGTGPEIWQQTGGRITHFVSSLGTSGTLMGTGRFLRETKPDITLVAVQPDSPFHGIEGLKHMETALVPAIYDPELADVNVGAPTEESYLWVRRLAREEGLLVGPSTGAALWTAVELAQDLKEGVIVCIAPDSGVRYLSESHIWEGTC
ncbi:MAG: cysteine synthase family protein [Proteobacteria bacterium]|nr:cysteine synthase family protein [Pseudomonadota bacterium]